MLPLDDYVRYGRQMILDGFGLPGQVKLKNAGVVVVGAGGLGCPALQYLAAAGVGRLGIVDHDHVELSNLARQVLHNEATVGMPKAESAAIAISRINSTIKVDIMTEALSASNAVTLLEPYDIILDCTDNAPTRYLLSDTAVRLKKPLVSGAAQKYEGQLCVYNLGENGPCYRCLYPKPPAQELVGTCDETGILGTVTGLIGNMQALETIKIIVGLHDYKPSLLLFSALGSPPFRSIKLRSRKPTCAACGNEDQRIGTIEDIDYVQFCGGARPDWETRGLEPGDVNVRVGVKDLSEAINAKTPIEIIDVRSGTEFGICHLPGSRSISTFSTTPGHVTHAAIIDVPLNQLVADPSQFLSKDSSVPTYVVCRLGNDSQIAVNALRTSLSGNANSSIKDVIGGLKAWSKQIDPTFPIY